MLWPLSPCFRPSIIAPIRDKRAITKLFLFDYAVRFAISHVLPTLIQPSRCRKCRKPPKAKPNPPLSHTHTHTHTPTHNLMDIFFAGLRHVLRRGGVQCYRAQRCLLMFCGTIATSDIGVVQAILVAYLALGFSALAAFGGLADDKDGCT